MKIGVLTLPLHTNYGGILQAYALQTVLKRMGHEVYLIDKGHWEFRLPLYRLTYWRFLVRSQYMRAFVKKHISCFKIKELDSLTESQFDVIIVGSDQVWRPEYFGDIEKAYLCFAKEWKIKRIAYAVSFGTDEWLYSPMQTEICASLVKLFDAVSVREESGQLLCRKYLQVQTQVLPDPTMLLHIDDYLSLLKKNKTTRMRNVLCTYFLDRSADKEDLIRMVAEAHQLSSVIRLGVPTDDRSVSLFKRIQPPLEDWIWGINMAKIVLTDSFHGCVFSILFHKPFILYANEGRGMARFQSLLKSFGLEDRLLISSEEYSSKTFRPIDWTKVDARLDDMRNMADVFLRSVL